MVQVSFPGVYVVEVPSGVHTITGVATSIAAFFGRASKGPLNTAVRVQSLQDYARTFGSPHPASDLALSVKQFFDNGGTDSYVVRLAKNAHKASITLNDLAGSGSLVISAKSEGMWGNGLRLEVDYNTPNPDDSFNLRVSYVENGVVSDSETFTNVSMDPTSPRFAPTFITQSARLIQADLDPALAAIISGGGTGQPGYSESRRVFDTTSPGFPVATDLKNLFATNGQMQMTVDGQLVNIDLTGLDPSTPVPASLAAIETVIANAINTQLNGAVPGLAVTVTFDQVGSTNAGVLRITSNSGLNRSVIVRRAPAGDVAAPLMLGVDQGGIEVTRYANLRPVPTGTVFVGGAALDDFTTELNALAATLQNAITDVTVAGKAEPVGTALQTSAPADPWWVSAGGGFDGVREKLQILAKIINADAALGWTASVWGYHLAVIKTKPSAAPLDAKAVTLTGAAAPINNAFAMNVHQYPLAATAAGAFFTNGPPASDGVAPGFNEYVGDELAQTGFHALDPVDLFNLIILPPDSDVPQNLVQQLWGQAVIYCDSRRAFLLVDPPAAWTSSDHLPVVTETDIKNLRATIAPLDHGAIFYPRIQYSDNGILKYTAPSGLMAGVMARIDSTRGVWKAPAGVEADLRGITDLEVNLTDRQNGVLNKQGVNALRKFPSGLVSWGARTLDGFDDQGSEWKYIPVRRLALFLEESLFRGTKWVVFEPNDEPLWAKIRLNVNAFMMGLFRQGAFQGTTPDKAFFVKCDSDTTTQNDRNLGIVNIIVGFAPLKPAEFVVIQIQQIAGDLA